MSEKAVLTTPIASPVVSPIESPIQDSVKELKLLLTDFITASKEDKKRYKEDLDGLHTAVAFLSNRESPQNSADSPIIDRTVPNRRSSMFFGSPTTRDFQTESKTKIQILQNDVVYDKELKVSSLEGLQYLSRRMQILRSTYPNRDIKMSHMVAYNLRSHVIQAYNTHCYTESKITGIEPTEIIAEDWLSLDNTLVQEILIESARPRTREMYSKELILFLGKDIPQTIPICTDNFSKVFYAPLVKSLNDLLSLYDLLSAETSNHSNNKSKMPIEGYGTTSNPGHVSLWILSLGLQKNSILQWLGKDELSKHKTLLVAVKYIKSKLLEGKTQSDARQDLDSKLTPIKYDDIRQTQGESYTRQQVPSQKSSFQHTYNSSRPQSTLHAVDMSIDPSHATHEVYDSDDPFSSSTDGEPNVGKIFTRAEMHTTLTSDDNIDDEALFATVEDYTGQKTAVALAFRGYCSELFVTGKCPRRDTNCPYDHSAAGQERCIQSFSCLAKRELNVHQNLPPYANLKAKTPVTTWPRNSDTFSQNNYKQNPANTSISRPPGFNQHFRDHSK
jgi:hypothetical protein